jgi:aromatic-L-amino-acid decarboxylase
MHPSPPIHWPASAPRRTPLDMDPEEFRRLGHALVDSVAQFLGSVPSRKLTTGEAPDAIRALIHAGQAMPETGTEAGQLLQDTARLLYDHSLFNGHPRFMGYVTSPPAPIGILGDLLAAAINPNVGAWRLSPVATEIEAQAVRWVAELVGYPGDAGGLFVSGGNMANMVGFFAARARAASWDVRAAGMNPAGTPALRVYASAETHTWLHKAADLSGLGTDQIRWIPTTPDLRMDTALLRQAIANDRAAGLQPMMVVGTAGSVSTGAVDPLVEIAEFCREEGIWFHVDGAYGALAALAPGAPADMRGIALADSVAVDPHKWLYAPLEVGCALVRDREALRHAFSYHPPYYHFGQEATNYVDFGPQNSRGFRALKVWLQLRQVGREGYLGMIGDDMRLAERLYARAAEHPELEAATMGLSIATFRYVPKDLGLSGAEREEYLNQLNAELLDRIQLGGEAFVSNAVVEGRYLLRACIVNFHTSEADVDAIPEIVARVGREVHGELRPGG